MFEKAQPKLFAPQSNALYNKVMINNEIKNPALIIATLTSILYLHGLAFHQGFLRYWGVDETLFPIAFERTLVQGYVAYMYLGSISLIPIFGAFVILFISTFIFNWVAKVSIKHQFPKIIYRSKENNQPVEKEPLHSVFVFSGWGIIVSYAALILLIILLSLSYLSDSQGYKAAIKQHEHFKDNNFENSFSSKISLKSEKGIPKEGNIILCNSTYCAIYSDEKVFVIKQSDISRMESIFIKKV